MILEKLKQGYRNISDKLFHTKEEYMGIEIIVYVVVEKQPGIKILQCQCISKILDYNSYGRHAIRYKY